MRSRKITILEGIAIGGSLGLLTASLFTPKSGEEWRSVIKERAERTIGEVKHMRSDAEMRGKTILGVAKHKADGLRRETTRQFAGFWDHAKSVVCG